MFEINKIYNMNCLNGMKELIPNNYIDLTVTSPPYDNLRKYKGYSFDFENIANELYRITKKGGIVVWIVGDSVINGGESLNSFRQALYFQEIGFKVYDTMIYQKMNGMPLNHRRYEQRFEYMFVLLKGNKPNTFNPIMVPCKQAGKTNTGGARNSATKEEQMANHGGWGYGKEIKDYKIKDNIWGYYTGNGHSTLDKNAFKHPAIFPEQLSEDHILSWSNEGDLIFDPFMGSGTTAKMAILNKRNYLGFELSSEFIEIAEQRAKEAKQKISGDDND